MKEDGLWARPLAWIKDKAPGVHRFLTRDDRPFPLVREGLVIVVFGLLLVTVLWGATGQPLNRTPVVVVESESMMHCVGPDGEWIHERGGVNCRRAPDVPYGRFGTIDPGDLVFVRDVDGRDDVQPWADAVGACAEGTLYFDCGCDGVERYGACGDVIIFLRGGQGGTTPIIHRTLFWLEIHGDGRYSVDLPESWGCRDLERVERSELRNDRCLIRLGAASALGGHNRLDSWGPEHSGWVTRGDNNDVIDQQDSGHRSAAIASEPIRPDWLLGKARGELPWIGLVKLFASDLTTGRDNYAQAPGDAKVLMFVTLGTIIGAPFAVEAIGRFVRQRRSDD